ncbi:NAD(P)/FAD-dependent oxidoreductase [Fundidesulfovibrio soli]|uniref:NAD(P)/FAD-dependent oxidoreductase n=1 Tax=Fundidesulfovibrio soli TaxID=2922716 RepID=UPI001FAF0983|nr:FAD-dependent oxidoreductase [Fundidesulfovibrio soli]
MEHADVVIVGAGIIGLTLARELLPTGASVLVIEKEDAAGLHASGRNSGVLHAGIYYAPGTARAATCLAGNRLMRAYCKERGLPLLESGKVIVASDLAQLDILRALHRRALDAGAEVSLVDEAALRDIEPHARTVEQAIHSPLTAVVEPKAILQSLLDDLAASPRARVRFGVRVEGPAPGRALLTTTGRVEYGVLVNAAGAHADTLAHAHGLGLRYMLVPFKGLYRSLAPEAARLCRGSIYPVPDPDTPFLGVHFTRAVSGRVHLGPTAIPAFGRENYGLLGGLDAEAPKFLWQDALLLARSPVFRRVALSEPRKYLFRHFFADAARLVPELRREHVLPSSKVGIRPQLVDTRTNSLVMDFVTEEAPGQLHVLGAISPAFTCSMALAPLLAEKVQGLARAV